jgi:hypothetical protein
VDVAVVLSEGRHHRHAPRATRRLPSQEHRVNRLAFGVRERADVDRFVTEFVRPRGIATLYESPREYPEYRAGYYAVFFEDPDRLKLEVVYVPGLTDRS